MNNRIDPIRKTVKEIASVVLAMSVLDAQLSTNLIAMKNHQKIGYCSHIFN